jgi:hypothetical protein
MRRVMAAATAIAILWMADIELNDGQYGEAIERAVVTILTR